MSHESDQDPVSRIVEVSGENASPRAVAPTPAARMFCDLHPVRDGEARLVTASGLEAGMPLTPEERLERHRQALTVFGQEVIQIATGDRQAEELPRALLAAPGRGR
ncbi:hypothetical protein [Candidatus Synechococcus spongiarum]|uniref:hypothetical protein n=1 Tax=Candidatus Synechococcus spongiarum TaxID=431041 RepID=UPI001378C19E|nr:hypothetical protein [Candidatus Synechococcus spongiarum]